MEHCSWEEATPTLKDLDRVPDPSTLRRWSGGLDCSRPADSFRSQTFARLAHWLGYGGAPIHPQPKPLSGLTRILQVLWPLRL